MFKDWFWVFRLSNDLQKILIRKEIESWELSSFSFKELFKVLLDLLEFSVEFSQECQESFDNQGSKTVLFFLNSVHFSFESQVVALENGVFVGKLLRDIWLSLENGLKVLPFLLHSHQDFKCLSNLGNIQLPIINFGVEFLVVWRTLHATKLETMVFNELHDFLSANNLIVELLISLRLLLINNKISCGIVFPCTSDVFKSSFNL